MVGKECVEVASKIRPLARFATDSLESAVGVATKIASPSFIIVQTGRARLEVLVVLVVLSVCPITGRFVLILTVTPHC